MANAYQIGDLVRVQGSFTTIAGVPTDPTAVFFSFKNPSQTITTYTYGVDAALVKDSTGVYHVDVSVPSTTAALGTWYYRFYSTGTGQTAAEDQFVVPTTAFL
jgi:hypothetical protein